MRNYKSKYYFDEKLDLPVKINDGTKKAFRQFKKEKP